jgi:hypothetical protein
VEEAGLDYVHPLLDKEFFMQVVAVEAEILVFTLHTITQLD